MACGNQKLPNPPLLRRHVVAQRARDGPAGIRTDCGTRKGGAKAGGGGGGAREGGHNLSRECSNLVLIIGGTVQAGGGPVLLSLLRALGQDVLPRIRRRVPQQYCLVVKPQVVKQVSSSGGQTSMASGSRVRRSK